MTTLTEPQLATRRRVSGWVYFVVAVGILLVLASVERMMGRNLISPTGRVMLWGGGVNSPENSQQLLDWYSLSHVIHGFIFYGVLWLIAERWPRGARLCGAMVIEAGWEMLENSSLIIDRYREATIALGYRGDSILNSSSDVLCCVTGFVLARWLPVRVTVALAVAMELFAGWMVRDNLTLNVIMLLHPFAAIRHWQMGA